MLAPEVSQTMGLDQPSRPDWRLRAASATLSMQDASMRSPMGLEEQSAPHLVPAMSSVMPFFWSVIGNRCVFWGAGLRQGHGLPRRLHALILMGDWCGLQDKPDTAKTTTRVRRHQRL
jgi:hypothetical protein